MNASEQIKYIEALKECPLLYAEESAKIKQLRIELTSSKISEEYRECCEDLLDSATIVMDMLMPFLNVISIITKFRGLSLFKFNQVFNCDTISALDLYHFLQDTEEADRKSTINRLTTNEVSRGLLNLAIETKKPKQFLSALAKTYIDNNILKGLYLLNYVLQFSRQTIGENGGEEKSIEVGVRYIFSQYEQLILDLAHKSPREDDHLLMDIIERTITLANFESDSFKANLEELTKIRECFRPVPFRKICRYLLYINVLGFYFAYDETRLNSTEQKAINQILRGNQFRNYGDIIRRKRQIVKYLVDADNRLALQNNFFRNQHPEVWGVLNSYRPFVEAAIERDKSDCVKTEWFGLALTHPDTQKIQKCIHALAEWGYIDNDVETKRIMYYRLTGCARPTAVEKITWHKDFQVLLFLIYTVYDKVKGKYEPIPIFFNTPYCDKMMRKPSSYAKVKDKNVKALFKHLYGKE